MYQCITILFFRLFGSKRLVNIFEFCLSHQMSSQSANTVVSTFKINAEPSTFHNLCQHPLSWAPHWKLKKEGRKFHSFQGQSQRWKIKQETMNFSQEIYLEQEKAPLFFYLLASWGWQLCKDRVWDLGMCRGSRWGHQQKDYMLWIQWG